MRKFATTILILTSLFCAKAQTSISFQHLGNATFQNNLINPSLIPEGKLFIGLPVISGVHANVNSKVSYNDVFTKESDRTLVDISKMVGELQKQNMLSTKASVNLLHVGYRLKAGPLLSFTANERIEGDFLYPKQMVEYVFTRGNHEFLNEDVKVSKLGLRASHFREFGLGLAAPVNDQLTVGIRAKYLIGFANVSVPGNVKATLRSNGEAFQLESSWENVMYRTSGLDIYDETEGDLGSHLLMNSNKGFAIDIGGTYKLNRYYTITGSIVDIGFINWKENIRNEVLGDTSFVYNGVDLAEIGNIQQTLEDSLFDKFNTSENFDPYRSWLPVTVQGSWIYHYSPQTDFYVTAASRLIQRQIKMAYGAGVTQKFGRAFTGSLSVTKLPQQFFNVGAAFTAKGGPVQLYMAVDQIINFNVPESQAFDFRFGMNFVIGQRQEKSEASGLSRGPIQGAKGIDTNVFLGKSVKTKKRDGIYSIIKKQKRRELKSKRTKKDNDVQKKSLNGRTGQKNTDNE
ncbi:MAG: DUF5723 family protein [Ekhidna sp.]|uniref:DUF5723 family protein n=1 Tax=Ekhidna sp. TaxID=2608089 RepID=UPI0032EDBEF1